MQVTDEFEERLVKRIEEALDPKFGAIGRKFDDVDKRLDEVNKRFDEVDKRFDEVDKRFDGVETRLDGVESRLENVEMEIKAIRVEADTESRSIRGMIQKLDNRIEKLETIAKEKWNIPEIGYHLDAVDIVIKKHTDQIRALNEKVGIAN